MVLENKRETKLNCQQTGAVPPKPGLIAKSWSSIRSSCSDLISQDLVLSSFFILRSTRLKTRETQSQICLESPPLTHQPLSNTDEHTSDIWSQTQWWLIGLQPSWLQAKTMLLRELKMLKCVHSGLTDTHHLNESPESNFVQMKCRDFSVKHTVKQDSVVSKC